MRFVRLAYAGLAVYFCLSLISNPVAAQTCPGDWAATVISAQGAVELRASRQTTWSRAVPDQAICTGAQIRVGSESRAAVMLPDEALLRLDQNTTLTFSPAQDDTKSWLELIEGAIHVISRDPRALKVVTPFANAGIEGTEFLLKIIDGQLYVVVFEGEVNLNNDGGDVSIASGGYGLASSKGKEPEMLADLPPALGFVRPRDAVQWTLYYPPVIEAGGPDSAVHKAARQLVVGRSDRAREILIQASETSDVLALRSIIAVTQNRKEDARVLADQAVNLNGGSAAAFLAQSYARQAHFDISGALASLQAADRQFPGNALVNARLSELWLAVGDVDKSVAAAEATLTVTPDSVLAQSVLGFARLAQVKIKDARRSFEAAIALDQGAPLPHLGRGLALIRSGDLSEGRAEIELAVILDPGNALIRSYMGKAYYEEKRDSLAESQYEISKQLDPFDPTAWFYIAIQKQTSNRPVSALHNNQQAIERNENRAVYRSQLLIDADLAARSASLGRIYNDLGFGELALREGWKSIGYDHSDFSGHRLLADTYSNQPRYEIARVNELFQSQLLQPINITPVQAQLGEANLFILDSAGPSNVSFNEFNPLFNRNRLAVQASGSIGNNDTWGNDVTISGVQNRWSFSLGQYHFETEGFRENNDLDVDVLNAFVQFQLSNDTTMLAEVRTSKRKQGDLQLLFDPMNFISNLRETEETDSLRFGIRHAFNPRSEIIGSVVYKDADLGSTIGTEFSFEGKVDGYTAELQHLYRSSGNRLRTTTGVRYTDRDQDETVALSVVLPVPPFLIEDVTMESFGLDEFSAYLYTDIDLVNNLTATVGASADYLDGRGVDKDQVNPKIGLTWQPFDGTAVRAAAFRTLQAPSFSRQDLQPSLEPTQVSGFNQFFFGVEGEDVKQYGLGIDQTFSENAYGGFEISKRELEVPFLVPAPPPGMGFISDEADVDEKLGRAYFYWTPVSGVAFSAEYQYEEVETIPEFIPEGFLDLETHRVPLQISYFHPLGPSAAITATFVDQEGTFVDINPPFLPFMDDDSFWVFDAFIKYRLPKRFGEISLNIKNLFDESFNFQDTDPENPQILPERQVILKFTLAFDGADFGR